MINNGLIVDFRDGFHRTLAYAESAVDAIFIVNRGEKTAAQFTFITQFFVGENGFAATAATITDPVNFMLDIITDLDQAVVYASLEDSMSFLLGDLFGDAMF